MPPASSGKPAPLDGAVYDLDRSVNKKFTYAGKQPALLIASATKGLQITGISGARFELLVRPYQKSQESTPASK
jgi:hypothetical protein